MSTLTRFAAMQARLTDVPFPAYTYVPGKSPHPVREPSGHSFGLAEPKVECFDAEDWSSCQAFLFGIDLFNAGFYWEAHEQWEAVWHAAGRRGAVADVLKGLIKLAAAGVKRLEGRPVGVQRHAARATELFLVASQHGARLCGFALSDLVKASRQLQDTAARDRTDLGIRLRPGPK